MNRLSKEKSPYLLQHQNNPVDWYPWGEEAFEKARRENKPIFLSIGYSTCHWCHVMERESFENKDIAAIMNQYFINIKVDREERPDVDQVYMHAVMAMTGSGGWPMSVFLTGDLKPFYGGTYFPPEDHYGRPGFSKLLSVIAEKWSKDDQRAQIIRSGEDITKALVEDIQSKSGGDVYPLGEGTLQKTYEQFQSQHDRARGGFGPAPKFPRSHTLSFLLRYAKRHPDSQALEITEHTLEAMARGGLYDHLGGGFHRYSTDADWHVPHFEKMLYDQALLTKSYLEAYQLTKNPFYSRIVKETFGYLMRDMTDPGGGFYSAEDADSLLDAAKPHEKAEGAFYVWSGSETKSILDKDVEFFNFYYDIREEGNAAHDPQGEFTGKNILREIHTAEETAKQFKLKTAELETILEKSRQILFKARNKRPRPHLDDKVLTDWNGLMISSLAFGSHVLGEKHYLETAQKAADFILSTMRTKSGRLLHRFRDNEAAIPGFLEDYAFFILGLLDLYEASFKIQYLEEAFRLCREMVKLFWDEKGGGFFLTAKDGEALFTKPKEIYDGAIPSGNSVACLALARAARMSMDKDFEAKARKMLEIFSTQLAGFPSGYPFMMMALDFLEGPVREIVIAEASKTGQTEEALKIINESFLPNKVLLHRPHDAKKIEVLVPFLRDQKPVGDKLTVYICKNYACDLPITNLALLSQKL